MRQALARHVKRIDGKSFEGWAVVIRHQQQAFLFFAFTFAIQPHPHVKKMALAEKKPPSALFLGPAAKEKLIKLECYSSSGCGGRSNVVLL